MNDEKKSDILPYFFVLENKRKILYYLGVQHSWDPDNPQFSFIRTKWDEFLSSAKNPLAVVESWNWKIFDTEKEAILKGGEINFMAYLCNQKSIPISCFEPNRGSEMNALLEHFPKEQIEYYYFARVVSQWHRLTQKSDIDSYLSQFLQRDREVSGWMDFEFSIENMKKIHKQLFETELDFNDIEFFSKIENPTREENPLKNIVRASGNYREQTIIKGIKNAWDEGQELFIVYGRGHALKHEEALRQMVA